MSTLTIRDLAHSSELDHAGMCAVRGGFSPAFSGPFANVNVNVGVNQEIVQLQNIEVNALNNIGVIGASIPFELKLDPKQLAIAKVAL
jgi:hypothetical protein